MPTKRSVTSLLAATIVACSVAPAARADDVSDAIIRECADTGTISAGHDPADLRRAIAELPLDAAEYTDCPRQLEAALRAALPNLTQRSSTATLASQLAAAAADDATSEDPADVATERSDDGEIEENAPVDPADSTAAGPASGAASPNEPGARDPQPEASPLAQPVGSVAAAGVVGASLLGLLRPAMLRRRGPDGE